jgi:hypothetical protein
MLRNQNCVRQDRLSFTCQAENAGAKVGPYRVPAVYLTAAFLWFFSSLLFRRINNLRGISPPEEFDSHPGHHFLPSGWVAAPSLSVCL